MLTLDSIRFSTKTWIHVDDINGDDRCVRNWKRQNGDTLCLTLFPRPDPPPFPLDDLDAFREFTRRTVKATGGTLIEADFVPAQNGTLYRTVYKHRQASGYGFVFSGSLVVDAHFSFVTQAAEGAATGARETMVALNLGPDAAPGLLARVFRHKEPWAADPYNRRRRGGCFKSDDSAWDEHFPDHPLTRVRRVLNGIVSTLGADG